MTDYTSAIQSHPLLGIAMPTLGWVPAPRYLLRRDRILRMLCNLPPQRVAEVGCGAGALIHDLTRMGHACQALETSLEARTLAAAVHWDHPSVRIHETAPEDWHDAFDYVMSFEVLEHIEDDCAALRQWSGWLKTGGHLLISVPSHERRWSASDVWAGHFRRYERAQLEALLRETGFEPVQLECYGFPLANVIEPIRSFLHARKLKKHKDDDRATNTARSGTERTAETRLYPIESSFVGTAILRLAFAIQSLFVDTECGTGYLVLARKK